jgi:hypothetical protein
VEELLHAGVLDKQITSIQSRTFRFEGRKCGRVLSTFVDTTHRSAGGALHYSLKRSRCIQLRRELLPVDANGSVWYSRAVRKGCTCRGSYLLWLKAVRHASSVPKS